MKRINWRLIFKFWLIVQFFCILFKIDSLQNNLFLIITFPVLLIIILLVFGLASRPNSLKEFREKEDHFDQLEFEKWEKSFNRNRKINKITNWW